MNRNRSIIYVASALVVVLVFAFVYQVRQLQRQLRSSVHIIPTEPKSRDVVQNGIEDAGASALARVDVLVKFRSGVSAAAIDQITTRFNDQLQDKIEAVPGLTAIDDRDDSDPGATAGEYRALAEVEYAEPNYEISINQTSAVAIARGDDSHLQKPWALTQIEVAEAWKKTKGSRELVIGVLDSGVEYTHVGLVNNIWTRPSSLAPYHDLDLGTIDDVHGYNAIANDGNSFDQHGQGTACAGIIGAECGNKLGGCGVNQHLQIMPLRFINAGGFGYVSDAVEAVNYAIDRKQSGVNLRVINASWGLTEKSRALEEVIHKAYEVGILFIVSAGDTAADNDVTPHFPADYTAGNILCVAASDKTDELSSTSNYGPRSVQVAAPGESVGTTVLGNDYAELSGSSMAAAIVTGVAALALSQRPDLSVDELRLLLLESVDTKPGLSQKVASGGRINAAKAIGAAKRSAFSH
jgi:subtilisin family serine protease